MAKKYLTEDNIKNILSGIEAKIPKELEVNINTNVNRVKVELLDSPVTLTVNSWGSISLNQSVLNFDEIEIEFAVNLGSNIQFRKYTISKSIISSMTTSDRYLEPLVIDAAVSSSKISQYARVIMRVDTSDYSKLEFNAGFGATSFTAEVIAIRGINYTQSYGDTPLGTIISYMGITPPDEYLSCDGTTYNIQDYWELAEFIKTQFGSYNYFGGDGTTTFAVPDLRGEFLRGSGTNSHTNQGSGSSVGSHQNATAIPMLGASDTAIFASNAPSAGTNNNPINGDSSFKQNASGTGRNQPWTGSWSDSNNNMITTRPTNTSVLYCIKYTNSLTMQPSNVYSTTEKRIGTWIDGSPLYQKTIVGTMPIVTTNGTRANKQIDISDLTISACISVDGVYYVPSQLEYIPINSAVNLTTNTRHTFCQVYRQNSSNSYVDTLFIASSDANSSGKTAYITLKYTKV